MVKRWLGVISFWLLVIGLTSCLPSGQDTPAAPPTLLPRVKHPDQLKFHPLEITIPKPQRRVLTNGLIIYLLENHELPLIEIIVRIRAGSIYDPKDKLGLANLTALLMRSGGAGKLTPTEFDETLESLGAVLNVKTDYEEITFSLSLLSQDLPEGLRLLSDVLRRPLFAEEKLGFEKNQLAEAFRRENDDPDRLAMRELRKLIYPAHPYGNRIIGNPETIKSITPKDLLSFYQQYVKPNNLFLGIAGDFRTAQTLELIKQTFGDWTPTPVNFPELPRLERNPKKSVNLVPKEINQSSVMLGHIAVNRLSPDYFPLMLMNAILGNSTVSRLYHKVREEEGLAYSIFSYFIMPKDLGMFIIETNTKNESVGKALKLILKEVEKIREEPVQADELKHTKEAIFNSFVFRFDNPRNIVDQSIWIEFIGLPQDYLETYRDKVMAVTPADILKVAKQYLLPDKLTYVVVGDDKKFDMPLTEFGPVNIIKTKD